METLFSGELILESCISLLQSELTIQLVSVKLKKVINCKSDFQH